MWWRSILVKLANRKSLFGRHRREKGSRLSSYRIWFEPLEDRLAPATLTWAPGHTPTAPSGGTGTWDTTTTNWSNGTADVAWSNANAALFGGTAGTVTVATGVSVSPTYMNFGVGGYTIAATGTGNITTTTNNPNVGFGANNLTETVSALIIGTGSLTVGNSTTNNNGGTLILSAANTYSGGSTINANAALQTLNNSAALGTANVAMAGANSTIQLSGGVALTITACSTATANGTAKTIENISGTNSVYIDWAGADEANFNFQSDAGSLTANTNNLGEGFANAGTMNWVTNGAGNVTLTNAQTQTCWNHPGSLFTANGTGIFYLSGDYEVGAGVNGGCISVNPGATMVISGNMAGQGVTNGPSAIYDNGTLILGAGNATVASYSMNQGNISGTGNIVINNPGGTVTMNIGNGTTTGNITILAGNLSVGADNNLGCTTVGTSNILFGNSSTTGSGTLWLTGAIAANQSIMIYPGSTATIANNNLTANANITDNGSLVLDTAARTIGGTGTLSGSGSAAVYSQTASGGFAAQYTLNKALGSLTAVYGNTAGGQYIDSLTFGGLTIANTSGTDSTPSSGTVTINGNLTVNSGGCLTANTSTTFTVGASGCNSYINASGNLGFVNLSIPASANVTVTGNYTASGNVTIGGTFNGGNNTLTGNYAINSGGTLSAGNSSAIGILNLSGNLTLNNGATISSVINGPAAGTQFDQIALASGKWLALPSTPALTVKVSPATIAVGTYNLITSSNSIGGSATWTTTPSGNVTTAYTTAPSGDNIALTSQSIEILTWSGAGDATNHNWDNPNNWTVNIGSDTYPKAGDTAIFSTSDTVNVDRAEAAGTVNFTTGASVTLTQTSGGTLTLGTTINDTSSGTNIISAPLTLGTSVTANISTGDTLTISGIISDGSNGYTLMSNGAGTLVLSSANTYGGGTTVLAGSLLVTNSSGSATGSGTVTVNSGATLGGTGTISGNVTVAGTLSPGTTAIPEGALSLGGNLSLSSGATLGVTAESGNSSSNGQVVLTSGTLGLGSRLGVTVTVGSNYPTGSPVATHTLIQTSQAPFGTGTTWTTNLSGTPGSDKARTTVSGDNVVLTVWYPTATSLSFTLGQQPSRCSKMRR